MSRRGKSHIGRMALWVREQGARAEAADHCEGGAGSRGTWGAARKEVRANLSSPDNAGKSQCFEVDVAMAARAGSCRAEAAGLAPRTAMAAQAVRLRGRFPETTQRVARGRRHFFPQLSRANVPFRCVPRAARWCCVREKRSGVDCGFLHCPVASCSGSTIGAVPGGGQRRPGSFGSNEGKFDYYERLM